MRALRHPIVLRDGTSDFSVFVQVFLDGQYDLPIVSNARFIIDAGANIGLSSLFFLSRNPSAQIIAIEPDSENFQVAAENLRPYRDRCHLVHGALWSASGELGVQRGTFGDGRHWATQTTPDPGPRSENVQAFTVPELLSRFQFPRVDFLKLDVEGAELPIFRDGDTSFLGATRCCAIECHGEECSAAVRKALMQFPFDLRDQGELTIADQQPAGGNSAR